MNTLQTLSGELSIFWERTKWKKKSKLKYLVNSFQILLPTKGLLPQLSKPRRTDANVFLTTLWELQTCSLQKQKGEKRNNTNEGLTGRLGWITLPLNKHKASAQACLTELKDNDTRHLSFNSGEMYWREFLAWNVQELRQEHQRLPAFVAAVYILLIDCVGICTGVRASPWRSRNNGGGWRPNSGCQSWWQAPFSTEPFHRPQLPVLVRH